MMPKITRREINRRIGKLSRHDRADMMAVLLGQKDIDNLSSDLRELVQQVVDEQSKNKPDTFWLPDELNPEIWNL